MNPEANAAFKWSWVHFSKLLRSGGTTENSGDENEGRGSNPWRAERQVQDEEAEAVADGG